MPKDKLPDPTSGPMPSEAGFGLDDVMVCLVAGGLFLFFAGAYMHPTMGATRSAHLKWEERKRQTQEAADQASKAELQERQMRLTWNLVDQSREARLTRERKRHAQQGAGKDTARQESQDE